VKMKPYLLAVAVCAFAWTGGFALAQGRGQDKEKHGDRDDHKDYSYNDHDREVFRTWYANHEDHLPPGLAKRDQLPPGLERQLVERGTLPPGLRKKIQPAPVELVRELPPPPPDCEHVVIGGHLVLLNRKTSMVLAVFHFEIH